jgi:hypothetical protein
MLSLRRAGRVKYDINGYAIPETYEELSELRRQDELPAEVADIGSAPSARTKPPVKKPSGQGQKPSRFISLEGIKPKPVRWLWSDRIPISVATLAAGIPGQGKSHICLDLAAKITKGLLAGDYQGTPSGVVVMSREDMIEETIVPRLIAAHADMNRMFTLPFQDGAFDVDKDMPELQALVNQRSIRLVILDPLLAFTMTDGFKEAEVRRMLEPAQRPMMESKISIVGIMHLNKDVMQDVLSRVTHSQAFTALVRSVLFVGADPDDDDELNPAKVLAHGKSNLSRIAPSMGFRLKELLVPGEDEDGQPVDVKTSAVEWLGESEITAEQLVKGRGSAGTKQAQAEALLRRLCPAGRVTIVTEAERLGISEATVDRAFQKLGGVASEQERDPDTGRMGPAMWRLPIHRSSSPDDEPRW